MRQLARKAGRDRAVSIQDRTSRAWSLPDRLRIIRSDQNECDPTLNSLASLSTQERRKSADPKSLHENRREPASNRSGACGQEQLPPPKICSMAINAK